MAAISLGDRISGGVCAGESGVRRDRRQSTVSQGRTRSPPSLGRTICPWLQTMHEGAHGNADLVRTSFVGRLVCCVTEACFGLIATNTIGQGDTRATGLRVDPRARRHDLPSDQTLSVAERGAAVIVSIVHVAKRQALVSLSSTAPGKSNFSISWLRTLDDAPASACRQ